MKKLFGKKTEVVFFVLILVYFVFFVNFLYEVILPREVFYGLQQRKDFLKNYHISFKEISGGLISGFSLHKLMVVRDAPFPTFRLSKLKTNISLLSLVKNNLFKDKYSGIKITLDQPIIKLSDKSFLPQLRSGLISVFDLKWPDVFTFFDYNRVVLRVKEKKLENQDNNSEVVEILNSSILWERGKWVLNDLNFEIFNFPLRLEGFLNKRSRKMNLNIVLDSGDTKIFSLIKGNLYNPKLFCKLRLFGKLYTTVYGNIKYSKSKFIFRNIKFFPSKDYSDLFLLDGSATNFFLNFPFKNFFNTVFKIQNYYELKGNYNYIKKKAYLDIKKITFKNGKEKEIYFDNYKYSQLMKLYLDLSKYPQVKMNFNIERFMIKQVNYITNLYLKGRFFYGKKYFFKGGLHTEGSILNYQPFKEFEAIFKINESNLKVEKFNLKDILYSVFKVELTSPHKINLKLNTNWIDVGRIIKLYYPKYQSEIKGMGKMKLILKKTLFNPYISGNLMAKDGIIKNIDFVSINCNFEGDEEWIEIYNSWLKQQDNIYEIFGGMSLDNIGTPGFLDKIRLVSNESALLGRGWSLLNKDQVGKIELKKQLNENFNIGFSTYLDRDSYQMLEGGNGTSEMELEYSLTEDKDLKLELREEEEIFGLQHSVEF